MTTNMIRVVLVDDHTTILEPLAARINQNEDLEIVGTATDSEKGLRIVLDENPDVVVLDVDFQGRGSFDVAKEISTRSKDTKIIFLTGYLTDVYIDQALKMNARGYLLKLEPPQVLIDSIRKVMNGEQCFSVDVLERLSFNNETNQYTIKAECRLSSLTSRQLEVLRYLAHGLSVKEVAAAMHLSEKSIDSHKYRIMHKLDIHDRVELARFAIREGLVQA